MTLAPLLARAVSLALALLLDLALGDPGGRFHPVVLLGRLISALERGFRVRGWATRIGGALLAAITVATASAVAFGISFAAWRLAERIGLGSLPGILVDAVLIFFTLAARTLASEGRNVAFALAEGDLALARTRVARIVGRETAELDEAGVARACIESLGENVTDGVIAPIFWAALLGPGGAWAHKAASTLDSMIGYRDERHAAVGWASAKLDDVLAFVPARLAILLVAAAALFVRRASARGALRVGWRDRLKHASPNSAHGEAAFAGALGVRLGGAVTYRGVTTGRAKIGAEFGDPGAAACSRAAWLVVATATTVVALACLALVALASR